ncbi:MAG: guanine deaminase [Caulobacteraceae bacterium]
MSDVRAYRAAILHMLEEDEAEFFPDGLLVVEDGLIVSVGSYRDPGDIPLTHLPGRLITPGFVDTHIHFPQVDVIASHGAQLLDWLNTYTFPAERAFADSAHAAEAAEFFLGELLRNGTTSALVFGSVHPASVDALFEAALARNMRLIAGKSMMDRLAPDWLRDDVESCRADLEVLIAKWGARGRLGYAITPRFALSCSEAELTMAGELLAKHDHVWLQTHLSENHAEIEATAEAFPAAKDYLDVYDSFGLVGPRSVFAHGVHLTTKNFTRLAEAGSAIAFCPTSNLFLGSGLFDMAGAEASGVKLGLGTDVGGGTSYSLFCTAAEAYKVCQMHGHTLAPLKAFYLATLGGARALGLADKIGNLTPGSEGDFLVLDLAATPLLGRRLAAARTLEERLFALMILADDRAVEATYVAGVPVHRRDT